MENARLFAPRYHYSLHLCIIVFVVIFIVDIMHDIAFYW